MIQQWKDIEGYEGLYQISNFGHVRSMGGKITIMPHGGHRLSRPRSLSVKPFKDGYCRVLLYGKIGKSMLLVHRLVASHFIDNPENKPQVNHKDGNKANNFFENLEWATKLENQHHAIDTGLQNFVGENSPQCILSDRQVLEIRMKYKPRIYSESMLAKEYGTSRSNINNILSRRTWTHI